MGRRLDGRFRLGRDPNARVTLGKADNSLPDDDGFDVAQDGIVVVQQLIAIERAVAFQKRDHFAVIVRLVALFAGDQRRQGLHLVADVHVTLGGLLDERH